MPDTVNPIQSVPHAFSRRPRASRCNEQSGIAALGVTVVLLLVVSLMTLYANRAIWLEQRTSTNQFRGKEALEAAEAGLERMLAVLGVRSSQVSAYDLYDFLSKDATTGAYSLVSPSPALVDSPGAARMFSVQLSLIPGDVAPQRRFQITSTGGSDCSNITVLSTCQSRAIASVKVRLMGLVANPPDSGLVSKSAVAITGNKACVANNTSSGGVSIRSGGSITKGPAAVTTPFCQGANQSTVLNGAASNGECSTGTTSSTTTCNEIYPSLSGENFFKAFFGATKAEVKQAADERLTDLDPDSTSAGKLIWIDLVTDNRILKGASTYGSLSPVDPIIIIIDGSRLPSTQNVRIAGNSTINGIIYIIGNADLVGSGTINGALIVEGSTELIGNLTVLKNQEILSSLAGGIPPVVKVMGSWKDWKD